MTTSRLISFRPTLYPSVYTTPWRIRCINPLLGYFWAFQHSTTPKWNSNGLLWYSRVKWYFKKKTKKRLLIQGGCIQGGGGWSQQRSSCGTRRTNRGCQAVYQPPGLSPLQSGSAWKWLPNSEAEQVSCDWSVWSGGIVGNLWLVQPRPLLRLCIPSLPPLLRPQQLRRCPGRGHRPSL